MQEDTENMVTTDRSESPGRGDLAVIEASLLTREEEVKRLSSKLDEQLRYRARLNQSLARQKNQCDAAVAEVVMLRGSFAFRIGSMMVKTARSPWKIFLLPVEAFRLLREAWPRISRRILRGVAPAKVDGKPDLGPGMALTGDAANWVTRSGAEAVPIKRMLAGSDTAPQLPDDLAGMRIATVMDEFSFNAYRHCGDLRQIGADDWRSEVEEFGPQMLMVESAWKGRDESWARRVYPLSREMVELVAWCRERQIPTVFWNKEDPVHLSVFMRTARQFDFVFTTDIDCVRAYKAALGHDQVYWLPFACQPAEHNPIEEYQRKDGFCFAGSFYAKYPERQHDFATIVESMESLRPVEIYDRNAGTADPALAYPDAYAPMIRGALPHDRISLAYKGYRYGININTVKQSQSMFARRAFDLLACNTVTVSNFSRGMRMLLGDLVICSDDGGELAERVRPLINDDHVYRKFRLAGLRKVMSEHTYQDRLRYVLEKVGGKPVGDGLPRVVVVAQATSDEQAAGLWAAFARQQYEHKELALVVTETVGPLAERVGLTIIGEADAERMELQQCWPDCWLACFHPDDHYGAHYLTDLALATRYSDADVIGKAAYHERREDRIRLLDVDRAYQLNQVIALRRAIVRSAAAPVGNLRAFAAHAVGMTARDACAIDEFNYCANGAGINGKDVDDIQGLRTGISLQRLHRLAETATAADLVAAEQLTSPAMDAAALAEVLPTGEHADGCVRLTRGHGSLQLGSKLAGDKHAYLYAAKPLPVEELFDGDIGKFNLIVDTEMLVSFVLIFLDREHKRIGHAIRACSSNLSISAPAGARYVRLGLRVQGPGTAVVKKLVLGHVPSAAAGIPARGRHLVVSRGYPSYENLYSYAYVHRRIRGYADAGVSVDVFRLSENMIAFSEFEGVDVVSGQLSDLELMIRSNLYRTLMVHSLDRALWSVLKEHAVDRELLVWVHGAEIQPWYRRDFSFLDERDRERGIQRSNDRMAFWRDLFIEPPPNVKFVFVSKHLVREAFRDIGVELDPSRYVVIHNHIDGELFTYEPKPVEQRNRLLSIRPYSRPTYANDLTIKAILDLVDEPFFSDLEFRLIGDGRLFDETLDPVRHLPNVIIEKRFLSQDEIAAVHKDYGVFLSPSRIDSQGVSRDEAMASGLVPITNRVSAIPEFVDDASALVVEPEDWRGMADAIRRLQAEPETFIAMSSAAAARVRRQSASATTLLTEVALIEPEDPTAAALPTATETSECAERKRIALYGDMDLNLIDGSAVWVVSLAKVLAGDDEAGVDLFLKAPIKHTHVIKDLLGMVNVRLIEPPADMLRRQPADALDSIIEADHRRGYDAIVLRGFDLALEAVARPELSGRLWIYLTDIPQREEDFSPDRLGALRKVADGAAILLSQTRQLERHLVAMAPQARGKTRLLPPMIPDGIEGAVARSARSGPLRLAYAGKFAPLWGIRELFTTVAALREQGVAIELHVFGDKIHNPQDDPGFRPHVRQQLESGEGVVWHRGLDRAGVLAQLRTMDVGWAWRRPELEEQTFELSTKLLEYAASGAPPLLASGAVNREMFGTDYPLFATSERLVALVRSLAEDSQLLADARQRVAGVAGDYAFSNVRTTYIAPLIAGSGATLSDHDLPGIAH
ncbi:glycosyltransferase family protein [Lysobacter sp. A289]